MFLHGLTKLLLFSRPRCKSLLELGLTSEKAHCGHLKGPPMSICPCRYGVGGFEGSGTQTLRSPGLLTRSDGGHAHGKVWAEDVSLLGLRSRLVLTCSQTIQTVHSIRCPEASWSLLKPTSLAYSASQDCGFFAAFSCQSRWVSKRAASIKIP